MDLLEQLRTESREVKECFTRFAFQATMLGAAVNGLIFSELQDLPQIGFAAVVVVLFLLLVARIGTHKYATANRHYGYQLYLERAISLSKEVDGSRLGSGSRSVMVGA